MRDAGHGAAHAGRVLREFYRGNGEPDLSRLPLARRLHEWLGEQMSGSTAFDRMKGAWTLIAKHRTQRFVG